MEEGCGTADGATTVLVDANTKLMDLATNKERNKIASNVIMICFFIFGSYLTTLLTIRIRIEAAAQMADAGDAALKITAEDINDRFLHIQN